MSYLRQVACYACEAIGAAAVLWRPSPSEEESFHIAGWDEGDFMQGEQDPYCASLSDESRCHWANWNKFIRSKAGADASVYPFLADLEPYNSATFTRVNTTFTTESPETLFFSKHEDIVYWSWKFALENSSESICYKPCGRPEPTPEPSPSPSPPEPTSTTSPEPSTSTSTSPTSSSTSPGPEPPVTPTPSPDPPGQMTLTLTGISLNQDVSSFKFSKATGSTADGSYAQLLFTMVGKREDYAFAVIGITIKNPSLTLGANNIRFKLGQPTTEGIECEVTVNGKSKEAFVSGMGYFPEFDEAIEIDGIEIGKAFKDITVSVTPEDKDRRTFLGWAQDITRDNDGFIYVKDGAIVPSSGTGCPVGATRYEYSKSRGSINVIDLDKETGTAAIPFTSYIRPYDNNVIKDAYSWGNGQFKKSTTDPYDSFIGELKNTGTNEWLISSKDTAAFSSSSSPEPFEIQCNTTVSGYTNVLGPKTAGFIGTVSDEEVTMFQGIWGTCNPSENHEQKHAKGDFVSYRLDNSDNLHYSFDTHDGQGGKVVRAAGVNPGDRLPMLKVERSYSTQGKDTYGRKLRHTLKRSDEATAEADWYSNNPFLYLYTGVTYPLGPITTKIYDEGNKRFKELQELSLDELITEGIYEVELSVDWSKVDMVYIATPVDRDDNSKFVAAGIYVNETYSETAFVDIPVGGIMMKDSNKITQEVKAYENIGTSLGFKKAQGRHNTWTTDDFYPVDEQGKQTLRAMTYQNYDKGHPSVLINPTEAFVEPTTDMHTAGINFVYNNFLIVVVKNGTSTEGATQREDTDVIDSVDCEDKYTIFSGSSGNTLGEESTTIETAEMLMRRVKPISYSDASGATDGDWFTATSYDSSVVLNNGQDSIASPWRSWEPLGISYSIWEVDTAGALQGRWVNHPAFIMRAKMTPGYIGCFLVLVDKMDKKVGFIPFRPVEFDMSNVAVGTHEFNAWPEVNFTKSYMVTGGSGVIYNLLNGGQPAGTLADILFYNMTGSAVYATVVDHENNATQYAYLRLENIPWSRGQLSKGDFIGTSMMATEIDRTKQFAGTINGLSKSISRPRITTDKRSNKNKIYMM